jgi:hypothetical protein
MADFPARVNANVPNASSSGHSRRHDVGCWTVTEWFWFTMLETVGGHAGVSPSKKNAASNNLGKKTAALGLFFELSHHQRITQQAVT